jgi:hypothetical protein
LDEGAGLRQLTRWARTPVPPATLFSYAVVLTAAASFAGCSAIEPPGPQEVATERLVCGAGKSFAGMEDISPRARFDGVAATIAATRPVAGLTGKEHVSAVVGIGNGERLYIAVVLGGFVNGRIFAFAYEYGKPGDFAYLPIRSVPPTSIGQKHSLRVRRLRGSSWLVEVDGSPVGDVVDLPATNGGLPYPHVFLSSTNTELPCDNEVGFAFSNVVVLPHAQGAWTVFPSRSQMRAWPGYELRVTGRRRFTAESE